MMEDLFSNVDLDLDLMGGDSANNLDFLPEDLFNFIDEDLKDIENGAIPDIESLINFDEDDQFPDDEIQWDFDLDTTDFFKNTAQEHQQQQQAIKFEAEQSAVQAKPSKQSNKSNQSTAKTSKSNNKQNNKSSNKQKKHKPQPASYIDQNVVSPSSTGYSTPNSPQSTYSAYSSVEGGHSSDSNDFLDSYPTYYTCYDGNNNLVSHPISELSMDELDELSNSLRQQPASYGYDAWSENTFDLSNNFGGFVNVQSALSVVNGAPSIAPRPKLIAKQRRTKSKGTSLLANKPKSYKTIKKEMLQKKHLSLVSSQGSQSSRSTTQMTNGSRLNNSLVLSASPSSYLSGGNSNLNSNVRSNQNATQTITIEPSSQPASPSFVHPSTTQITVITTFAQDHDYCSSLASPF